jgi:hypothetical protein
LSAIGITAGQTVAISVTHPIDHMVFACALYRMKVASASIDAAVDTYLERVRFDVVLSDKILPAVSAKQPSAKFIIVDPSWFQDKVALTLQQRTSASRDGSPDWVARITCSAADSHSPALVETSARTLEEGLMAYCISAPPDWTRMISIAGLHSDSGFVQALSALWLGRSVCFADVQSARNLSLLYRHDYLVGSRRCMRCTPQPLTGGSSAPRRSEMRWQRSVPIS